MSADLETKGSVEPKEKVMKFRRGCSSIHSSGPSVRETVSIYRSIHTVVERCSW